MNLNRVRDKGESRILGDMNARHGDVEVVEVISKFGISGLNWPVRRMVQFSLDAGLIA